MPHHTALIYYCFPIYPASFDNNRTVLVRLNCYLFTLFLGNIDNSRAHIMTRSSLNDSKHPHHIGGTILTRLICMPLVKCADVSVVRQTRYWQRLACSTATSAIPEGQDKFVVFGRPVCPGLFPTICLWENE